VNGDGKKGEQERGEGTARPPGRARGDAAAAASQTPTATAAHTRVRDANGSADTCTVVGACWVQRPAAPGGSAVAVGPALSCKKSMSAA